MSIYKIKSHAKINLYLGVLKKLKSQFHKIESLISFIELHDIITIKQTNGDDHKVVFYGKFSKKIPKKNTVTNLLDILDKKKLLKNKKYLIKINKKIPQKSGLGGGSINASSVFMYLIKKNKLNLKFKQIKKISNQVGSDVILGMEKKNSILKGDGNLIRTNKKLNLHTLIIKPNIGCKTERIYKNVKIYSKEILKYNGQKMFKIDNIFNLKNDLEKVSFSKYPILLNLKRNMLNLPSVLFVRMTGSGSSMVAYFNSKKAILIAAKILKRKYKKYWCIVSKTI